MPNCHLTVVLALFLIISLASHALLYRDFSHTVQDKIQSIEYTLISHDGRRNAQYGVILQHIRACNE